jgi:TonB-linked SusC/RagA family outer membrane protein
MYRRLQAIRWKTSVLPLLIVFCASAVQASRILPGVSSRFENHTLISERPAPGFTIETPVQSRITGSITDENAQPLPGVSVLVKGTTSGTVSDSDGRYSIDVADPSAVLTFSFIGYVTQEIPVGNNSVVNVRLVEDTKMLGEVVVVGFGEQSRETITTSVSKMDLPNVASAMQGTISGVRVQSLSGQPGAAPRVIIRGGTSINNPNGASPLYIIDGVIRTNINDIAAEDIESLQVLKDAASTAIYGARGSNGVVIITTKSGKSGQARVTYNYDLTFSEVGKTYDMASARDYLRLTRLGAVASIRKIPTAANTLTQPTAFGTGNDLTANTGFTTQYLTPQNEHKLNEGWESMPDPVDPTRTLIFKETDWQDVLFRNAMSHNHHISVSGGTEKATFNAGVGYMTSEGVAITTEYDRISVNLNGELRVKDNLSLFGRALYTNSGDNEVYDITQVFFRSAGMAPTAKYTFEDGTLAPGAARNIGNPAYHLNNDVRDNSSENVTLSAGGRWEIIPGLTFDPQVSLYKAASDAYAFTPAYQNGANVFVTTRTATSSYSKMTQMQADAIFNYSKTVGLNHNIDATAGFTYFDRNNFSLSANGRGAATDLIPTLNASAVPVAVNGSVSDFAMLGYFGRINYNFNQKYLFSITSRYDGASNLGAENKWGFFPAISAGWNLHNEPFWQSLTNDNVKMKLRASYGVTGNISGLSDFQAQGAYSVGARYMDASAIENSIIANQNLKWEQSKTFDMGADFGLFNDRVGLIVDYYRRVTDDLLTNLTLPQSTGFTSIFTNLGSLENRGFEIELTANVLPVESALQWSVSANASHTQHKILELPPNGTENNRVGGVFVWDESIGDYAWKGGLQEGGRIGDYYAWNQIGIYATDEEALGAPVDMTMPFTDKTKYGGDANYLDADGDGIIDTKDLAYMGNPYPEWTGGFSTSLGYKGLNLFVRMDYTLGHTIYNYAKVFLSGMWAGNLNMPQEMVDKGWAQQGDIASRVQYIPGTGNYSYWRGSAYHLTSTNSEFYEKGDFLNLREVTLSYTVPSAIVQKLRISALRFNVTGSNLHYFTNYTGMNPEDGGNDQGRYPLPRNLTFGALVSF